MFGNALPNRLFAGAANPEGMEEWNQFDPSKPHTWGELDLNGQPYNVTNNPLPPPAHAPRCRPRYLEILGDREGIDPNNEPTIVTVRAVLRNYVGNEIETNLGNIIGVGYHHAVLMGMTRFNFRYPNIDEGDQDFLDTATPPVTGNIRRKDKGVLVNSRVRCTIRNLPGDIVNSDGDVMGMMDLSSNSVNLDLSGHYGNNGDVKTVSRMYTQLVQKYLWDNDVKGLDRADPGGSGFRLVIRDDYKTDQLMVDYTFQFIRGPNWQAYTQDQLNHIRWFVDYEEGQEGQEGNQQNQNEDGIPRKRRKTELENLGNRRVGVRTSTRISTQARAQRPARVAGEAARRMRLPFVGASGVDRVGADYLDQLKQRIYTPYSLGSFFQHSKASISTPDFDDNMCFPMAFMRSQKRTWKYGVNGMESVEEGGKFLLVLDEEIIIPEQIGNYTFFSDRSIQVFDNSKRSHRIGSHGKILYENEAKDLSVLEKEAWHWCAHMLHNYVEEVCRRTIPVQDFDLCLAAYSYTFQVYIAVYVWEMKGERIRLETANVDRELNRDESFIAMIRQGNHMHAISDIRHYQRTETGRSTCLHSYCDYCATISYSRTSNLNHQRKCGETDSWKALQSLEDLHAETAKLRESKTKFKYLKKEKAMREGCSQCNRISEDCICTMKNFRQLQFVECETCKSLFPNGKYNEHDCYMKSRNKKESLDERKLFVYDIEASQALHEGLSTEKHQQHVHHVVLVILRAVYDDREWVFHSIGAFVDFLILTPDFAGSNIIAHNGGGYDHQFVLRYLEDNSIMHSTIPRPGTIHKYLEMKIKMTGDKTEIRFTDFMMLMCDSLKNIGTAFELNVSKGDFPHRFSLDCHMDYVGPLPRMDDDKDWYGFRQMKSAEDLKEAREHWTSQGEIYCTCESNAMCSCNKPKWDYQVELEKYCRLDVLVLAGAVKAYRNEALSFSGESEFDWKIDGIDPFCYMTQSQVALALFTQGKSKSDVLITHEKVRPSFNPNQIVWLENQMVDYPQHQIQHAGNSLKEWYDDSTRTFLDGYCPRTKTAFEYFDCVEDGCPICHVDKVNSYEHHPTRQVPWKYVIQSTKDKIMGLMSNENYHSVEIRWSHEDNNLPANPIGNVMKLRDCFYGGRTEVFMAYCNPNMFEDQELKHIDVCSLYPYVCAMKQLPIGKPTIYFNRDIQKERLNPSHPDRYFGFARIRVKPNVKDLIAILPERVQVEGGAEKLMYDLKEKEGSWHTELIYLAMEHDYEIMEVYEVWHWPESQRSTELMKGYIEFFLRMKQEAEGWEKLGGGVYTKEQYASITEEMKDSICEQIFLNNGGFARPRKEFVKRNPVKRQLAKIYLNCLWGKLCQKNTIEFEKTIYGYKQYLEILSNVRLDQDTIRFRHVAGSVFKVRYSVVDVLEETNRFINIPIAASVTAHAQVHLMRKMFEIGVERIAYCDTDSIMAIVDKDAPNLHKTGLGNWTDEHIGATIQRFWALAPKCYLMDIHKEKAGVVKKDLYFKCKGVRSTEDNRQKTGVDSIHQLVESAFLHPNSEAYVEVDTMTIHPNSTNAKVAYGTMLTCYGKKRVQTVYSKRILDPNEDEEITCLDDMGIVRLLPFGYEGDITHDDLFLQKY